MCACDPWGAPIRRPAPIGGLGLPRPRDTLWTVSSHLDERQLEYLRQRLLLRGVEINRKLADVLSGDLIDVDQLIGRGGEVQLPGLEHQDSEDRLRGFLVLLGRKIRATQHGTYGLCERCGTIIPYAELERLPWMTRCQDCRSGR